MDSRLIFLHYLVSIKTEGGTRTVSLGAQWFQSKVKGDPERQIRRVVRQENPLRRGKVSVPQTDTGGREEYSKALG
jgi:hypothetical protein